VIGLPPVELGAVIATDAVVDVSAVAVTEAGAPGTTALVPIDMVELPDAVPPPEIVEVAVSVNVVALTAEVGVPEITPVDVLRERPAGSEGDIE
jgi:hypothetical protein